MNLSPAQLRALRNLDVATDTHGNACFWESEMFPGWFWRKPKWNSVKRRTLASLERLGLIERCPDPMFTHYIRISPAGADELRRRGYVVYTRPAADPQQGGEHE